MPTFIIKMQRVLHQEASIAIVASTAKDAAEAAYCHCQGLDLSESAVVIPSCLAEFDFSKGEQSEHFKVLTVQQEIKSLILLDKSEYE